MRYPKIHQIILIIIVVITGVIATPRNSLGQDGVDNALIIKIIPTYGRRGVLRENATFWVGEMFYATAFVSGVAQDRNHKCDLRFEAKVVDEQENSIWSTHAICNKTQYYGCSDLFISLCFPFHKDMKSGRYFVEATVTDNLAGKTTSQSFQLVLLPSHTFGVHSLKLVYADHIQNEDNIVGANPTVGVPLFCSFVVENVTVSDRKIQLDVCVAVVDDKRKSVILENSHSVWHDEVSSDKVRGGILQVPYNMMVPIEIDFVGRHRFRLIITDRNANNTVTCDLPLNIQPLESSSLFITDQPIEGPPQPESPLSSILVPTYGDHGPPRCSKYLAGEPMFFSFRASNLTLGSGRSIALTCKSEILDSQRNVIAKLDSVTNSLPDSKSGCLYDTLLFSRSPPLARKYYLAVSVTDNNAQKTVTSEQPLEILPENSFGATSIRLARDEKGEITVGQHQTQGGKFFLCYGIHGPTMRDGHARVETKLQIVNKDGTTTDLPDLSETHDIVPVSMFDVRDGVFMGSKNVAQRLPSEMVGDFMYRLVLTDLNSGKTVSYDIPITVHPFLPPNFHPQPAGATQ